MSWKSFACVAALSALAAPAVAQPTIGIVDNMDGTAVLNITTDAAGALGAELALELSGATLTGATVNTGRFDDANPGDNPFLPGSPVGGDSTGLALDLANNRLFASYGSADPGIGTFEFLTFSYTGTGDATASGLVAQNLSLNDGLSSGAIGIGGGLSADFDGDGMVDIVDLDILGTNFGLSPATQPQGDASGDGVVDIVDLDILGAQFGMSAALATAVPEPTAMVIGMLAFAGAAAVRRS